MYDQRPFEILVYRKDNARCLGVIIVHRDHRIEVEDAQGCPCHMGVFGVDLARSAIARSDIRLARNAKTAVLAIRHWTGGYADAVELRGYDKPSISYPDEDKRQTS